MFSPCSMDGAALLMQMRSMYRTNASAHRKARTPYRALVAGSAWDGAARSVASMALVSHGLGKGTLTIHAGETPARSFFIV